MRQRRKPWGPGTLRCEGEKIARLIFISFGGGGRGGVESGEGDWYAGVGLACHVRLGGDLGRYKHCTSL